jgi:hypothetical protein
LYFKFVEGLKETKLIDDLITGGHPAELRSDPEYGWKRLEGHLNIQGHTPCG